MGTATTSHYAIFDYWKEKRIDNRGDIVNYPEGEFVLDDWAEPCCWACGTPIEKLYKDKMYEKWREADNYKAIWNHAETKHILNRCHIIPAALGGKDEPSNLFLMCEECHILSPDTNNKSSFLRWVYRRKKDMWEGHLHPRRVMEEVDVELKQRGLPDAVKIISMSSNILGDEVKAEYLNGGITLSNYIKTRIGLHGTAMADSSLIATVADWFQSMYLDSVLTDGA